MVELIIIVLCIIGWKVYQATCDSAYTRYATKNIDSSKMFRDRYVNGQSAAQVRRNVVHGKYDKKQHIYIVSIM